MDAFQNAYGWAKEDLIGEPVTMIMPERARELHQIGFSRFLATEKSKIAGHPLSLSVLLKDGSAKNAEHFILAERKNDKWRFAAIINPR